MFLSALEFMVIFNIKLKIVDHEAPVEDLNHLEFDIPRLEPDLASLVVFGSSAPSHLSNNYQRVRQSVSQGPQSKGRSKAKRLPMRRKAQVLIM